MKEYADTTHPKDNDNAKANKEKTTANVTTKQKATQKTNKTKTNEHKEGKHTEDEYKEDALEMATMTFKEKMVYKRELHQKRMEKMDSKEKCSYILGYYKWHIIITVFAIVCLAYAGRVVYRMTWPTLLELAIVNNTDGTSYNEYIPNAYREYYHLNEKNYIEIYGNLAVSATEDTTEVGLTMSNYQTIGYYNMYDMLDVIICDKEALNLFVSTDDTTAIDLSMDEDLYMQLEDNVVTMSDPKGIKNDGNPYTVALDISNTEFAKKCNLSYSEVFLLIPSTKYTDNENTINFIKFVFGI